MTVTASSPRQAGHQRIGLRLRLTLYYGGLVFAAGAALIAVNFWLTRSVLAPVMVIPNNNGFPTTRADVAAASAQFQHDQLQTLLVRSLIALAVAAVIALAVGYLIADRALRPLQQVTATARRLSETTLHERINLQGSEDEIKELADTFDAMLDRLAHAFEAQRRFVANASHELRTPLAINRTLLDVALADPAAGEDLKVLGRTLLATNARHERLIEGLLVLASSDRALATRDPVDLRDVAQTVLATTSDDATKAGVTVTADLRPAPTSGDPVLLERLVSNLVDNAIKYNEEGGQLWVTTGVLERSATVYVENTGPLVPPYEIPRLFEPFRRLETDRTSSDRGAGLGLSIVGAVVRAHGGTVSALSRDGGGLAITVRLPPVPPVA